MFRVRCSATDEKERKFDVRYDDCRVEGGGWVHESLFGLGVSVCLSVLPNEQSQTFRYHLKKVSLKLIITTPRNNHNHIHKPNEYVFMHGGTYITAMTRQASNSPPENVEIGYYGKRYVDEMR